MPSHGLESVETAELVVLLHGIARTCRSMSRLEKTLQKAGYEVLNVGYPSTRLPLEDLVEHIQSRIEACNPGSRRKTHFVGYSLGGLMARGLIHKYRPSNLGRVVLLAPPNQGSEVADFWKDNPLFKWFFGPAGQDLGAHGKEFSRILGPVDYAVGVIAGNCSWDPIASKLFSGPNDGRVSLRSTRVEGMTDHIVLPTNHTFILLNREAMRQVLHFLHYGHFDKAESS